MSPFIDKERFSQKFKDYAVVHFDEVNDSKMNRENDKTTVGVFNSCTSRSIIIVHKFT